MLLVKLGGGDFDLDGVAEDLAGLDRPFLLLHGANRLRDRLATDLDTPPRVVESISGYTSVLSDDAAIDVMLASYAGIRNKRLVEALRRHGVNAVGLTGLDGGIVQGTQNRGIRVQQEGRKLLLRDQSGKPREVNVDLLGTLLADGYTPVLTVPIVGEDGAALNTENDDVLTLLALKLGVTEVVSLIEEAGFLRDRDDPGSLMRTLTPSELAALEAAVDGRMRRKVRAMRTLFEEAGADAPIFRLADGRVERPVSAALAGAGTVIHPTGCDKADPGIRGEDVQPRRDAVPSPHELDVYGKRGPALVSGRGVRVTDTEGRSYFDFIGGNGALALGHRHPALERALRTQTRHIWQVPGAFVSPVRNRFLERLHRALPSELSRTFLSNSGTEAVEAALKVARAHTGRDTFVAAEGAFHGRTMGALSVTAGSHYREAFEPLPGPVRRVRFNDREALDEVMDDRVAALILEPVQGEGGVHVAEPAFLRAARQVCDAAGALLILDEVQTGFGRTGRLFAFQHTEVVPDVLCLAKSIAGGLPLGATVVREGIDLPLGTHGSTFGGNPLACAVAEATLQVLQDTDLLDGVEPVAEALLSPLLDAAPRVVREVRRSGLLVGIQLRVPVRPYLRALQDRGLLALSAGRTVLRLLPPLTLTGAEAAEAGAILRDVLSGPPEVASAD